MNNKVLLVGDIHAGVNKNNPVFYKTLLDYGDWINNVCNEHSIDRIIQLGDIYDNRFNISVQTMHTVCEFFDILKDKHIDVIVGNHDSYYNYDASINSLEPFKNRPNIRIHDEVTIDNDIVFAGWGVKLENIPPCRLFFGHIDVVGYELTKGKISQHGFKGAELMKLVSGAVFTGHYHHPQTRYYDGKPLCYTGSAYALNWNDVNDKKYIYILDLDTLEYTKIENTISPRFINIVSEEDLPMAKNNFVHIHSTNRNKMEELQEKIRVYEPIQIKTILHEKNIEELAEEATKTLHNMVKSFTAVDMESVISDFVDRMANLSDEEKQKVKLESIKLYKEFNL